MAVSVAIISEDTLHISGLKSLLQEYFGISPIIFYSIDTESIDPFDLYIVDNDIFTDHLDFFIPRRGKTIILSNQRLNENNKIGIKSSTNEMIDFLKTIIHDIEEKPISNQNELSQREIDVLRLIAEGNINKEIADKLNISINTVLSHRKNITSKLGIRSVSGLSFYAMMHGYITSI